MSQAAFDKKFGPERLSDVPTGPGVYLLRDRQGHVVYVGKAKNLRRRLQSYRNASAKRAHRKMRVLVRAAAELEVLLLPSERAALLRENELIRTLAPKYNVDGAFSFLYPAVGVGGSPRQLLLGFSTSPERYGAVGLTWYGCFRSRPRVKLAFEGLVALLSIVAHRERSAALPDYPRLKGSRVVGFRQVPPTLRESLTPFLAGISQEFLPTLSRGLLSRPRALKEPQQVQLHLQALNAFFTQDTARLRVALDRSGRSGTLISQEERDALFITSATATA